MAKFAEHPNVNTQFHLGQIFEQCSDKAWSQKLTAKLYLQLARQGYRRAQHRLGCMYEQGFGVPKNIVKAYAWCKVSASQHSLRALLHLEEIEAQMSAQQIDHGRKLSKQYYETYVAPFSN